jgi:predicted nucleotidyltransferase
VKTNSEEPGVPGMHPAIRAITEQISHLPAIRKIVLFGSRARGDHDDRSDIDLAVVCPGAGPDEWARIWNVVDEAPTLLRIDLLRLEQAGQDLKHEVEREGIVLYECP